MEESISRRTFLRSSAIAGMAAAVAASPISGLVAADAGASEAEDGEERIVKTLCRGCVGRCGILAHVKNGRVIKVEGDPAQIASKGTICAKGLSAVQALYNPNRIKYPMRRVGERGENKWERISWEEALDQIADELMDSYNKYGGETLLVGYGGGGHPYSGDICQRFLHVFGSPNIFEPGGMQCLQPRQTMSLLTWGGFNSDPVNYGYPEAQILGKVETKAMVMWGTNPGCSNIGQIGQHFVNLRANGCKTVVVDPRLTPDASKADVWLPVRPGSDVALMMSWINYILFNDLFDHEAVMKWTNLPYLVNTETKLCLRPEDIGEEPEPLAYVVWDSKTDSAKKISYPWDDELEPVLEGGPYTINGVECMTGFQLLKERVAEWTIERAAEVCWLDVDAIEEAIKIYVENSPAAIAVGMSSDHSLHSTQAGVCQVILESIMGNFCKPGNLMQQFGGGSNPYGAIPGALMHYMPKEQYLKKLGGIEYKASNRREWVHNSSVLEAMLNGTPYKPHILLERSLNKLINMPNAAKWEEGLRQLDLIVHHTMYPTSESMLADILLPATEWLESYWVGTIENRVYVRQPATHLWESLDEPTLIGQLAKRMAVRGHKGFQDTCDPEVLSHYAENTPADFTRSESAVGQIPWWGSTVEMLNNLYESRGAEMNWDQFVKHVEENGFYQTISDEEYIRYEYYKRLGDDGLPLGFSTPSKKIELYGEQIVILGRTGAPWSYYELPPAPWDYDPLPYFNEPENSPYNPEYADYPMIMTGGHIATYTYGTLRNVPWIRERHPVPELLMNPADAEEFGLADGDWAWIESKIGRTQGKVTVTNQVGPRVLHMERFWFPENVGTSTFGYREANVNMLTDDQCQFNPIIGTCTYRGFQVKVYKAEGAPEGIWTEPEQFAAWLPDYEGAEVTSYAEIAKEADNA